MEGLLAEAPENDAVLFETAQYYAAKADYEKAVDCYERAFAADPRRPRFQDALMGIAGEIAMASGNTEGLMAKARGYVEEHYREAGLRLRDVANHVGLSTNYFSSMFAKNMGQGFADYLIERRMREALILLGSTDKKNYEVAQLVGYDNPAYFSTAFKKYTGFSISDYRRSLKNRPKDGSEKINKLPD